MDVTEYLLPKVIRATETEEAIYKGIEKNADSWMSRRLGASVIGNECLRALWLGFRWAHKEIFQGRMLSLFGVGHWAEIRMAKYLSQAGMEVSTINPETKKQWTYTFCEGHGVDKIDGAVLGVKEAMKTWHLWECKTSNDKGFKDMLKKGLRESKPVHFAQVVVGMAQMTGVKKRGLYTMENKNDSTIYMERIRWEEGCAEEWKRIKERAKRVVFSPIPLTGISSTPTFFKCKFCDYSGVCFGEVRPLRNCRTCMHSTPMSGGEWVCEKDGGKKALKHGEMQKKKSCHRYIPSLLVGLEQVDVVDEGIVYKTVKGETWVDNGR